MYMTDESTLPIPIDELKAMMDAEEANTINEDNTPPEEPQEIELGDDEPEEKAMTQEEIFEKTEPPEPEPPVKGKKKRQLSQKQLDALARARVKGLEKRRALAAAKKKEAEIKKLEKTKHIRAKKQRQLEQDALIMAHAEEEVEKKEKAAWDEERLVDLMNRTMDTYFDKRKKEKMIRTTVPPDPATQGYYVPAQPPPPQRVIPKPQPQPDRTDPTHPDHNPYLKLFNLK
jgi:hypothetical protein